jgi:hypothetical protein
VEGRNRRMEKMTTEGLHRLLAYSLSNIFRVIKNEES